MRTINISILSKEKIFNLLDSRFDNQLSLADLPDPSTFKDMDRAVERIVTAISKSEKIFLIGDYDVDGVISTSIMIKFFHEIGVELDWIIPNRFRDGYGLSVSLIPKIQNANLVITVDNGISAVNASKRCKELGIDLIITDHHIVPKIVPEAYAIIDQKQTECDFKYHDVCGAQIAWYLCSALNRELNSKIDMKSFLAMTSIAIIADIMPLQHINRAMVKVGLKLLSKSVDPYMVVYREYRDSLSFSSEDIAFGLAPILNSAGRLEDASLSVEFITASSLMEAKNALERLIELNESRKSIERELTLEVIDNVNEDDKIIVVSGECWHEGVVGIVASKIKDRFDKPAIILNQTGDICKGSGRSICGYDLFKSIDNQAKLLDKYGGHSAAVGLSISFENLDKFKKLLNIEYDKFYNSSEVIESDIIGELSFRDIDCELIELIERFEPYGEGNTHPKFSTTGVKILAVQCMGKEKNHLRFTLEHDNQIQEAVMFHTYEVYEIGDNLGIVYKVSMNHFRGESSIQLMIEQIISID